MYRVSSINVPKTVRTVALLTLAISITVMAGWLFHLHGILRVMPRAPTMKFNTALLFAFWGMGLLLSIRRDRKFFFLTCGLGILLILGGLATLLEYTRFVSYSLDEVIVADRYSTSYPGRMSEGTASCFILSGIAMIGVNSRKIILIQLFQSVCFLVSLIAVISIIADILQIAADRRFFFINTMALHTAFLFLICSIAVSLKNASVGFTGLLLGDRAGSRLMRSMVPFIILTPVILSDLLLFVAREDLIDRDFGIVIHTVLFIILGLIYLSINVVDMNKTDEQKELLSKELKDRNLELSYFKQALDASFIVTATDEMGNITYVNDNFCHISQFAREETIGQTHSIVNSRYHPKRFFRELWNTISLGKVWDGEFRNQAKDGSIYWVKTTIVPFQTSAGKIYRYLSIRQDITQEKEAEELLKGYIRKLELQNEELEQFAYITSHDLQEPLRTITSLVHLLNLEYDKRLDENANKYLTFLSEATFRMQELITGLLLYSRIGSERKLELIDCNDLLREILSDLQASIRETKTIVEQDELPVINGYRTELRLLFQNLINNAIKFRKKTSIPRISISVKERPGTWKFSIADNGIGFEEKYAEKIFVIFQRLHGRDAYEGTGIGLAHCRKIVQLHGGDIWVNSRPDKGSTFHFTISTKLF